MPPFTKKKNATTPSISDNCLPALLSFFFVFLLYIISFAFCTTYSLVHHLHFFFCFALIPHLYPPSSIFSSAPCVAQVPPHPLSHPTPSLCCDSQSHLRYDIDTVNGLYPDLDESWAILCSYLIPIILYLGHPLSRVDPVISILLLFCSQSYFIFCSLLVCRPLAAAAIDISNDLKYFT